MSHHRQSSYEEDQRHPIQGKVLDGKVLWIWCMG